jgi:hypothetical protein
MLRTKEKPTLIFYALSNGDFCFYANPFYAKLLLENREKWGVKRVPGRVRHESAISEGLDALDKREIYPNLLCSFQW